MLEAARGLIGARLVRDGPDGERVGRILEVEAYGGPEDRASHARFGRTRRTDAMFGPPGRAYVYRIYGIHTCLNVVTGPAGSASAVLLRAVEPLAGIEVMRRARVARAIATRRADRADAAATQRRIAALAPARLVAGPAMLAAAFDVVAADDGRDLLDPRSPLRLQAAPSGEPRLAVRATARVGVDHAGPGWADRPWRFVAGSRPGPGRRAAIAARPAAGEA